MIVEGNFEGGARRMDEASYWEARTSEHIRPIILLTGWFRSWYQCSFEESWMETDGVRSGQPVS